MCVHACTYLNWCALYASNAQSHSPIVDLIVGIFFEQSVGYLSQTESLLAVHGQRHNPHAVQVHVADLGKKRKKYISHLPI